MSGTAAPVVLHVFSTFAVGGPQVRFVAIANRLGPAYRHLVVAIDGRYDCAARLPAALRVAYPALGMRQGAPIGATLRNAAGFRQVLRDLRPDVLVTYNWGSIEWAMANIAPVIRQVHIEDGFGPEERDRQLPRRVWMRRLFLRRATIVLPSRTLWTIARTIWRLPEHRLRQVPNGIDLTRFAPAAGEDPARPWRTGGPVIGTVAALRAEKNLGRLIRAFARLRPPARLLIVGDGPCRAGLEALAGELGVADRVRFAGAIADPAPLYAGMDVFALSSDTEQMPLSVLEAMASGLPVAATDVGDVRHMVAAANHGSLVPRDDAALAKAIGALLADPPRARAIGSENRRKAERDFDEAAMFAAYRALFDGSGIAEDPAPARETATPPAAPLPRLARTRRA